MLSSYENGRQCPSLANLVNLLRVLGCSADEFGSYLGPWGGVSAVAWDLVVPAISPRLRSRFGRFLRRSQTPGDAEDLVQETFLRVLQAEARGSAFLRDPAAYLWRVADRVAYDQARNLRTQKPGRRDLPGPAGRGRTGCRPSAGAGSTRDAGVRWLS
jgi:hypothetical protein